MNKLGRVNELPDDDPRSDKMRKGMERLAQFRVASRKPAGMFELVEEAFHVLACDALEGGRTLHGAHRHT
jgi:hypothetical protein